MRAISVFFRRFSTKSTIPILATLYTTHTIFITMHTIPSLNWESDIDPRSLSFSAFSPHLFWYTLWQKLPWECTLPPDHGNKERRFTLAENITKNLGMERLTNCGYFRCKIHPLVAHTFSHFTWSTVWYLKNIFLAFDIMSFLFVHASTNTLSWLSPRHLIKWLNVQF